MINKYTVGKYLRKQKNLRKKDPTATIIQPKKQLADYIHDLKKKGLVVNDLAVAQFKTKNGLPYYGLIATQVFKTNKIFIRVPVHCLLNTKIAFESDLKPFFQANPKYFSKHFESNWEDHILLAYLLYEFSKGTESEWYHLITNLPRDIDYVIFWDQKQIKLLEDPTLEKIIIKQRKKYFSQTEKFLEIAKKYPEFFPSAILNEKNVRWIHIHLVTRCFGKYFQYTTMVPFAQLLNHQCSDVYYTMYYNQNNPHNPKQQFYDEKLLTQEEIQDLDTSEGTYNSQEHDEFFQDWSTEDFDRISKNKGQQIKYKSDDDILKSIRDNQTYLYNYINYGDNVSLGYLLELFEALHTLKVSEVSDNIKRIENHRIQASNALYYNFVKSFYNAIKGTSYKNTLEQKKIKSSNKEQNQEIEYDPEQEYFPKIWEKEKFDQFLMLCSSKDQFEKHSQIFFCYGRLSNRMLLMRYGISLEYNKYNHIYLHLDTKEYIDPKYTIFPRKLIEHRISRIKNIKVKRTKFCLELLAFLRGLNWKLHENTQKIFYVKDLKLEFKIINQAIQIYTNEMKKFSRSLSQNQQMLEDKKVDYHEYFALIYIIEKQRIIQTQIKLLKIIQQILRRVQKKINLQMSMLRVHQLQDNEQMKMHRVMLKPYFDRFEIK